MDSISITRFGRIGLALALAGGLAATASADARSRTGSAAAEVSGSARTSAEVLIDRIEAARGELKVGLMAAQLTDDEMNAVWNACDSFVRNYVAGMRLRDEWLTGRSPMDAARAKLTPVLRANGMGQENDSILTIVATWMVYADRLDELTRGSE